MLEVRNLTKRFFGSTVVDRVNFSVRAGEISGYLGPKRLRKIQPRSKCDRPASPHRRRKSFSTVKNIRHHAVGFKHRLGYMPEEPNLYGYLTGLEYLQLAGGLRGLTEPH